MLRRRESVPALGENIDDYVVLELLGKGGFASVYRAQCRRTGRQVAVKMIEKHPMRVAGLLQRVRQEVEIHSRLKHPSVLELLGFFEDEQRVYLVLELCLGGELQKFLRMRGGPLREEEAARLLEQVVEGLLYLHSHQILHRDLTLSNLLLTHDMHLKIGDFGLATQLRRAEEKHMTLCGTPNFISPEVATRSSQGLEVDVWGVGVLLYSLLVGRPPFESEEEGVRGTLTKVVMAEPEMPSALSSESRDLLGRLLRKNPRERIGLKEILGHPFLMKGKRPATGKEGWVSQNTMDSGLCTMSTRSTLSSRQRSQLKEQFPGLPVPPLGVRRPAQHWDSFFPSTVSDPISAPPSFPLRHNLSHISTASEPSLNRCPTVAVNTCNHSHPCANCSHLELCPCRIQQKQNQLMMSHHCPSVASEGRVQQINLQRHKCPQPMLSDEGKKEAPREGSLLELSPPLETERLRPTRQRAKNMILSLTSDGEVCLEFLRGKEGKEKVMEVCRISKDGLRIALYQPKRHQGAEIRVGDNPPPLPEGGADAIFSYESLPQMHWKKYVYAARFVGLVKAKTPKVTLYSPRAKCMLMENVPSQDFEVCFYEGGKVTRSLEGVKVIERGGASHTFPSAKGLASSEGAQVPSVRSFLEHFQECLEHCQRIEAALEGMTGAGGLHCFPVVVGRRPAAASSASSVSERVLRPTGFLGKENLPPSRPGSAPPSTAPTSAHHSSDGRKDSQVIVLRRTHVPGVGIATQLSSGEVEVEFSDGLRVKVSSFSAEVKVKEPNRREKSFRPSEPLPDRLQSRLAQLPHVLEWLVTTQNQHPT